MFVEYMQRPNTTVCRTTCSSYVLLMCTTLAQVSAVSAPPAPQGVPVPPSGMTKTWHIEFNMMDSCGLAVRVLFWNVVT